ncbi:MAG: sulfatase-like hydrolase/transferase [Rhodothermales bacterium]
MRVEIRNVCIILFICSQLVYGCADEEQLPPPNILWITTEDISPNLGSYGDEYAHTPNLDAFAREGVVYLNAFATAPVCAVARSSIISGMYSPSFGTQHMRTAGRLPSGAQLYPELLQGAGYYVSNNSKTDYNLDMDPKSVWDESSRDAHWRNRPDPAQPFFSIFNFTTTHESRVNEESRYLEAIADVPAALLKEPGDVPLPPYYPDTDAVRTLWARYYNIITAMDREAGAILKQLEEDGLAENTIVIFYSDHGAGIPRHKRWLFDSGLRVPLIVRVPDKYADWMPHEKGTETDELVSFIDFPATALHLADVLLPGNYQGRAFLGPNLPPVRSFVFAGRDRMDERYDTQRAVRDKRFKYIRYYEPFKPYTQYMNTPEKGEIMSAIRDAGIANMPAEGQHIVAPEKPAEALYDLQADPYELTNLVTDPKHAATRTVLRNALATWTDNIKDTGLIPETVLRQWETEADASIYDVMRSDDVNVKLIRETAVGDKSVTDLLRLIGHENAAVRYWAAVGLGNRAEEVQQGDEIKTALQDPVPAVRIAAARAVALLDKAISGDVSLALPVLTNALQHTDEWVRLYAAQVIDEMDEEGRAAVPDLRDALSDQNKYVVRVVNRALNELEKTSREVP